MGRSKRSATEQQQVDVHPDGANNNDDNDHRSDNDLHTPPKRARLNLTGGDSSVAEETKAAGYIEVQKMPSDHDHILVTPGLSVSKRLHEAAVDSETNASFMCQSQTSEGFLGKSMADGVRRSLFTEDDSAKPQLVTPARSESTILMSPAKRRLIFGRATTEIMVQDSVKKVYALIRKLTGSIGGNASHGPIYGELTMGSMQKMVNLMKEHSGFDQSSRFLDVGSGIGKPNFHVAYDPGVNLSYGLEVDADRWLLSMHCLRSTLGGEAIVVSNEYTKTDEGSSDNITNRLPEHKCVFMQGDIRSAKVFDPFTHVYMFSIGFPPALWLDLSEIWNRSRSLFLICFHGPRDIIRSYGFDVELLAQTPTSMHGSKEGHTGYLYSRLIKSQPSARSNNEIVDPLFADGIDLVRGGSQKLKAWIDSTLDKKMCSGPTTRARRRLVNKSDSDRK